MKKRCLAMLAILCSICLLTGCQNENNLPINGEEMTQNSNAVTKTEEATKMGYDDLYANINGSRVKYGMTETKVKELLGEPSSVVDSRIDKSVFEGKGFIHGDYAAYNYDGCTLTFFYFSDEDGEKFRLGDVYVDKENVLGPRDIKVGMKIDEAMEKFFNDGENRVAVYAETAEPWGKRIYGDFTNADFDSINYTGEYASAYQTNASEYDGTYTVSYVYYKPAEENGVLKSTSECGEIVLYVSKEGIVTAYRWSFSPELE